MAVVTKEISLLMILVLVNAVVEEVRTYFIFY